MIKFLSLLAISISVFYSPSINAHRFGGTPDHSECKEGTWTDDNGDQQHKSYHKHNPVLNTKGFCN